MEPHNARLTGTRRRLCRAAVYAALALVTSGLLVAPALAQTPGRRVVSLVPSATEAVFAMGAGSLMVGVGTFDAFPPEVSRLPRIGALLDPDVERILSLRPDLMICYASQTELHGQLARAGIRLFKYKHGSLADVSATIRELGDAIGRHREGDALATSVEHGLAAVRARVAGEARPRVMLVIGRESGSLRTIQVSGGYGFLHDLVEAAGGANVFAEVKRESLGVSTETVLARAPEVIIELKYAETLGAEDQARELAAWQALPGVPAIRDRRVRLLSGGTFVVPGPRVVATAEAFARILHPGVYR
jgi:iron complex transport system substrate-binding protein